MPWCLARIRLPNPAIAVNPDTSTALPVLRAKMLGVRSSAKRSDMNAVGDADANQQRQRHDVRQIEGNPNHPINPVNQSEPMPTGNSIKSPPRGCENGKTPKRQSRPTNTTPPARNCFSAAFHIRKAVPACRSRSRPPSANQRQMLLVFALPNVVFGIDLQQKFTGHADKLIAQGRRQIVHL